MGTSLGFNSSNVVYCSENLCNATSYKLLVIGNCKGLTTRYAGCDGRVGASNGTKQKQNLFC